jgi:hypothetical protein
MTQALGQRKCTVDIIPLFLKSVVKDLFTILLILDVLQRSADSGAVVVASRLFFLYGGMEHLAALNLFLGARV